VWGASKDAHGRGARDTCGPGLWTFNEQVGQVVVGVTRLAGHSNAIEDLRDEIANFPAHQDPVLMAHLLGCSPQEQNLGAIVVFQPAGAFDRQHALFSGGGSEGWQLKVQQGQGALNKPFHLHLGRNPKSVRRLESEVDGLSDQSLRESFRLDNPERGRQNLRGSIRARFNHGGPLVQGVSEEFLRGASARLGLYNGDEPQGEEQSQGGAASRARCGRHFGRSWFPWSVTLLPLVLQSEPCEEGLICRCRLSF
jgi:hypothetical protein